MKSPQRRGTAISPTRRQVWRESFAGYRHTITDDDIENWLQQFQESHRDIAARILDAVEYITSDATTLAYRNLLTALPGWDRDPDRRNGVWKFVPFSLSEGESGNAMMHTFRTANNLAGRTHNSLFANWSQLASLGRQDTVVFIDDFSGSGSQVVDYWPTFDEVLANGPTVYLLLVATTTAAQTEIANKTSVNLRAEHIFNPSDNIFAAACKHFTKDEKDTLLTYCQRAYAKEPRGHGSCGLLVVLAHKAPNNSIPVLHKVNQRWSGLFRRYN
jgi:hypothetical protein